MRRSGVAAGGPAKLVDELAEALPELAPRIRAVFTENDILQQFFETVGLMGANNHDLTNLAMLALAAQSLVANWAMIPTGGEMARLLAFVRFRAAQLSGAVDPTLRPEIAAGLIVQALALRNGWVGASGSISDVIATQFSDAAHSAAVRTLGIDLRHTPLHGPRSPLEPLGHIQ